MCGAGESDAQCVARAGGPGSAAGRQCVGGRVRSYGESYSCEECVSSLQKLSRDLSREPRAATTNQLINIPGSRFAVRGS